MTSNNNKTTKWAKFKIFILVVLILIAGASIPNYFAVTTTASLNKRIYFIKKGQQVEKLKTGDYVMFPLLKSKRGNDLPAKLVKMIEDDGEELQIKRIGCSAGEEIRNIGNEY